MKCGRMGGSIYKQMDGYCCEIEGCVKPDTCGVCWGGYYLRLCAEHCRDAVLGKDCPQVKGWVIQRESKRDKKTGKLPFKFVRDRGEGK